MNHRSLSIFIVTASAMCVGCVNGAEIRVPAGLRGEEAPKKTKPVRTNKDIGGIKKETTVDKDFHCYDSAGSGNCVAAVNKKVSFGIGAAELAADMASEVAGIQKSFLPNQQKLLAPDDFIMKLSSIDEKMAMMDDNLDCSEEGCLETIRIDGFLRVDWNCKIEVKRTGLKISKEYRCFGEGDSGVSTGPDYDDDFPDQDDEPPSIDDDYPDEDDEPPSIDYDPLSNEDEV